MNGVVRFDCTQRTWICTYKLIHQHSESFNIPYTVALIVLFQFVQDVLGKQEHNEKKRYEIGKK